MSAANQSPFSIDGDSDMETNDDEESSKDELEDELEEPSSKMDDSAPSSHIDEEDDEWLEEEVDEQLLNHDVQLTSRRQDQYPEAIANLDVVASADNLHRQSETNELPATQRHGRDQKQYGIRFCERRLVHFLMQGDSICRRVCVRYYDSLPSLAAMTDVCRSHCHKQIESGETKRQQLSALYANACFNISLSDSPATFNMNPDALEQQVNQVPIQPPLPPTARVHSSPEETANIAEEQSQITDEDEIEIEDAEEDDEEEEQAFQDSVMDDAPSELSDEQGNTRMTARQRALREDAHEQDLLELPAQAPKGVKTEAQKAKAREKLEQKRQQKEEEKQQVIDRLLARDDHAAQQVEKHVVSISNSNTRREDWIQMHSKMIIDPTSSGQSRDVDTRITFPRAFPTILN